MSGFRGKIGVIGAGALGCFYGARLARSGADVHFLMRRDYEAVRARGLRVKSYQGDFEVAPPVHRSPEALGPCDLVLVGLKATDNAVLPALLGPVVHQGTAVLTFQNGFGNEEQIAAALAGIDAERKWNAEPPLARVLGATAFLCSHRIAPGVIHHMDQGWLRLAEAAGPAGDRACAIAEMFRAAGIECEVYDSLARARWEKLVWNIPFNGLGVAAESADAAIVLADPELRAAARGLMEEVIAAAGAEGFAIDPKFIDRMFELTEKMGPYKSSMQLDYEAGRPLEVEAILGEPLRRARKSGAATPRLELLCGIARRKAGLIAGTKRERE